VDALLARVRPGLVAYFTRRLTASGADDLAQLVLIRLARALPQIDASRADAYLATVVQNVLRTAYHQRAGEHRRYVPLELASTMEAPEVLDRQVEYEDLACAVARVARAALPAVLRDVVFARLRGYSVREIAARQRVNPITVRTRLQRARAVLRHELAPFADHPPRAASSPRAAGCPR
jgi:RNA polymerase sigma factor (sigma-70 family)